MLKIVIFCKSERTKIMQALATRIPLLVAALFIIYLTITEKVFVDGDVIEDDRSASNVTVKSDVERDVKDEKFATNFTIESYDEKDHKQHFVSVGNYSLVHMEETHLHGLQNVSLHASGNHTHEISDEIYHDPKPLRINSTKAVGDSKHVFFSKVHAKPWPSIEATRAMLPYLTMYHNTRPFGSCVGSLHRIKVPAGYNISGFTNRSPWLELFDGALLRKHLFEHNGESSDHAVVSGGVPDFFLKSSRPRLIYIYQTCGSHKFDFYRFFAIKILPLLQDSVIIYSGGGDCHVHADWSTKLMVNSKKVIHWFSENLLAPLGKKMSGFPIGLCQRHLLSNSAGSLLGRGIHAKKSDQWVDWESRKNMILKCGFDHTETKGDRRQLIRSINKDCSVCSKCPSHTGLYTPPGKYYEEIGQYKFVLSPKGMGADCYRTFEILSLGSVPVVPHWAGAEYFIEAGLPILLFGSASDLSKDRLDNFTETWGRLMTNTTELKYRISHEYWKQLLTEKLKDNSYNMDIRVNCTQDKYCTH